MSHRKSKVVPRSRRRTVRGFEDNLHELLMDTRVYRMPRVQKEPDNRIGLRGNHLRLPHASVIL